MSDPRHRLGRESEALVRRWYVDLGYHILGSNIVYHRTGELDLVARRGGLLVFVEVRSSGTGLVHPFLTVGRRKQLRLVRAATLFLAAMEPRGRRALSEIRFDLVGVLHDGGGPHIECCEMDLPEDLEVPFWV